jgi:hypothetical protein
MIKKMIENCLFNLLVKADGRGYPYRTIFVRGDFSDAIFSPTEIYLTSRHLSMILICIHIVQLNFSKEKKVCKNVKINVLISPDCRVYHFNWQRSYIFAPQYAICGRFRKTPLAPTL